MDAILSENRIIYLQEDQPSESRPSSDDLTLWVKDGEHIKPSTELKVQRKLEPGVYTVSFSRDEGYWCEKLDPKSDELFVFSNSITETLIKEINTFWAKSELYDKNKLIHKRGILLEGYPGTGKTSMIVQCCEEIIRAGGVVFKVTAFHNLDQYVMFMRTGFRKIEPNTPIITILEDVDQYEEVQLELLDFLDGQTSLNHHIVIATTNNTIALPDTFLRPSRFDLRIEVILPCEIIRREYFQFKGIKEEMIEDLVVKTDNCSMADLKEVYVCIFLLDYTVDQAIAKVTTLKSKKNFNTTPKKLSKIGI